MIFKDSALSNLTEIPKTIILLIDNNEKVVESFGKQLNFFNISDYTFQEATKILDSFPSNKPLLFLSSFVDKKGETKDFYSSIRYIQEHTTSPIYHFYEHGIGYGLLGGKVVIFKEQGRLAAKIAVEVLEGKDISQIKPKVTLNQYVFDYNELKKHRLSHKIPENSIVINKPKSFLDQPILNILIEIIIGLCVLVMFMIYLFYSLRQKSKQLLSTMKEQSSLLTLFDRGDNVLFKWKNDTTWSISYVSSNVSNLLGYSKDEFLNKKIVYAECIHNDDIKKVSKEVDNAKKFHKTFFKHTPYRLITKNGEVKWILDYTVPIYNEKEKIDYFLGIVVDITKEKRIQNTLEKLIDSQSSMIVLSNGKRYSFANKKFYDFFGCESLEKFYKKHISISSLFVENDRFFHLGKVTGNKVWMETIQLLPENERVVAIPNSKMEICAFSVNTTKFDENTYLISFTDISQTMINQIKLEEKTIHDKLTGVYNREFFDAKYNSIFEEFQRNEKLVGLAIFDIDFFKKVNDTFGHDVGDKILIKFVKKIIETSRDEDYLIRWGGEEFLLLLKVTSKNALIFALEKIRESIEKADFDEVKHLTCSIGASIYKKNEKVEQVIKRADKALYNAKENGRNKSVIFTKELLKGKELTDEY